VVAKALKHLVAGCFVMALIAPVHARKGVDQQSIPVSALPAEAQSTLALIKQGGPFPYAKDGVVFGNYEHQLPSQRRGYYHEYTVPTPGARTRGARRIIVGGIQSYRADYFYTGDHYASFQRIKQD
jgi:ribonuclease T1